MPKIVGFIGTDAPAKPRFEWLPTIVAMMSSYVMLWLASRLPGRSLAPNAVAKLPEYRPEIVARIEGAVRQARSGERSTPVPLEVAERLAHLPPGRFSYDLSSVTHSKKKLRRYKAKTSLRGAITSTSRASRASEHPHLLVDTRGPLDNSGAYRLAKPVLLRAYRADGAVTFTVEDGDIDLSAKPVSTKKDRAARRDARLAKRMTRRTKTSRQAPEQPAMLEPVVVSAALPTEAAEPAHESEPAVPKKPVTYRQPRKASPLVRAALAARHHGESTEEPERSTAQKSGVVLSLGGGRQGTAKIAWGDGTVTTHPAVYFAKHNLGVGDGFIATIVSLRGRPVGFEEIVPTIALTPRHQESEIETSMDPQVGVLIGYDRGKARVVWEDGKVSLLPEAPFRAVSTAPRTLFIATPGDDASAFAVEPAPEGTYLSSAQADRLHGIDSRAKKAMIQS